MTDAPERIKAKFVRFDDGTYSIHAYCMGHPGIDDDDHYIEYTRTPTIDEALVERLRFLIDTCLPTDDVEFWSAAAEEAIRDLLKAIEGDR